MADQNASSDPRKYQGTFAWFVAAFVNFALVGTGIALMWLLTLTGDILGLPYSIERMGMLLLGMMIIAAPVTQWEYEDQIRTAV